MATSHIVSQDGRMYIDDDDDTLHYGLHNNNNNNNRRISENHYVTEPSSQRHVNNIQYSYGSRAPVCTVGRPLYNVRGVDDSRYRTRGGFNSGLGAHPGPSSETSRKVLIQSASLNPSLQPTRRTQNVYLDSHVTAYPDHIPPAGGSMDRRGKLVPVGNPPRRHSSSRLATSPVGPVGLKYSGSVQSVNRYQPLPPGANHVITQGRNQHQQRQQRSYSPPLIVVTSSGDREPLLSDRSSRPSVTSQIHSPGGTRLSPGGGQRLSHHQTSSGGREPLLSDRSSRPSVTSPIHSPGGTRLSPGGGQGPSHDSGSVQIRRSYTQPSRAAVADSRLMSTSVAAPGNRRSQIHSTTAAATERVVVSRSSSNINQQQQQQQQQQQRHMDVVDAPRIRQSSEVVYAAVRRKQVADNRGAAVNGVAGRVAPAADQNSIHARASSAKLNDDVIDDDQLQQEQEHQQLRRMNGFKSREDEDEEEEEESGSVGGMDDGRRDVAVTRSHTADTAARYVNGDVLDSRRDREEEVRDYNNDEEKDRTQDDSIEEGSWSGDVTDQQQQQQQQQQVEHSYVNSSQANRGSILTADSDEEEQLERTDSRQAHCDGEEDELEEEEELEFGVHWLGSVAVREEDLVEDSSRREQLARCISLMHQLKYGSSQQVPASEPACLLQLTEDALDIVDIVESDNIGLVQSHQYVDIGYCQTGIENDSSLFAYVVFDRHLGTVCHVIDCVTTDAVRRLVNALAPRFGCATPTRDRPPRPPPPPAATTTTTLTATTTSTVVKSNTLSTASSSRQLGLRLLHNDVNNNNNNNNQVEGISSTLPVNHQNDVRCFYIGRAQTSKQIGVKVITSKTSAAFNLVPRDRWADVTVRVTPTGVYLIKLVKVLDRHEVQDIKYAGINSNNARLCGYVVKNKSRRETIVHVFYCEQPQKTLQLCDTIRSACEGRLIGGNFDERAMNSLYTDQPGTNSQLRSTGTGRPQHDYTRTIPPPTSSTSN